MAIQSLSGWRDQRQLHGTTTKRPANNPRVQPRRVGPRLRNTSALYHRFIACEKIHEIPSLILTDNVSTCGFDGSATSETSIHPLQKALFRKISVDSQTGDILCE